MQCTACGAPLTGGLDTFGEVHLPMCMDCFFSFSEPTKARIIHTVELDEAGHLISVGVRIEAVSATEDEE